MNQQHSRDLPGGCPPQDITDPATGGSRLLSQRCATCILRGGDPMHLGPDRLRVIIGQALAAGSFVVCHDTLTYGDYPDCGPAICRGFFEAYSSRTPALILLRAYQRLVEVPPPEAASPGTAAGN
jgi:guanyl-specific ribonuclease Sa